MKEIWGELNDQMHLWVTERERLQGEKWQKGGEELRVRRGREEGGKEKGLRIEQGDRNERGVALTKQGASVGRKLSPAHEFVCL